MIYFQFWKINISNMEFFFLEILRNIYDNIFLKFFLCNFQFYDVIMIIIVSSFFMILTNQLSFLEKKNCGYGL